jgi:hypothetical protein
VIVDRPELLLQGLGDGIEPIRKEAEKAPASNSMT